VANEEHVKRLKQGVLEWNAWRNEIGTPIPDLSSAHLIGVTLVGANLIGADMQYADLHAACLSDANLRYANLTGANLIHANLNSATLGGAYLAYANLGDANLIRVDLSHAKLTNANLSYANLRGANLSSVDLSNANLTLANLTGTNLSYTQLYFSIFGATNLIGVIGLETCHHRGPSIIDHETLQKSGRLPLPFLRGIGLPDRLIDYLPSLMGEAIQYYSCFISYSMKDQDFADRIHSDLQNHGVRCWFAPHDLKIGDHLLDEPDAAIRVRDKVLLILSENSIGSSWVKKEVTAAFDEEDRRKPKRPVLFPVRIDDAVMETNEAWAAQLRHRLIGDFKGWKDHDGYKKSFERVLRDLKRAAE
jgi:hypothetical protein